MSNSARLSFGRAAGAAALGLASLVGLAQEAGSNHPVGALKFQVHETAAPGFASFKARPTALAANSPSTLSVAFAADGKQMTAADERGAVRKWSLPDPEPTLLRESGDENLACAALSPESARLAYVTAEGEVFVSALSSQEPSRLESIGEIIALTFSRDGKQLVGAASNGRVNIWYLEEGARRVIESGCEGAVQVVAISPDSSKLAVAAAGGPVKLHDLAAADAPRELPGRSASLAFSPDGRTLAAGGADGAVRLYDLSSKKLGATLTGHTFGVWSVAFSPGGKLLASASWDGSIRLWDPATGGQISKYKSHSESVTTLAFAPNAGGLVSAGLDGKLLFWPPDVPRVSPLATLSGHPGQAWVAVFSPDGKTLLTGGGKRGLALWDFANHRPIANLEGHETTRCAAFSPDGAQFVTGGSDGNVWLWDAKTGEKLYDVGRHPSAVSAVVFSPDGATLASACDGKVIKLWELTYDGLPSPPRTESPAATDSEVRRTMWKEKATWRGCREQIYCANFSPHGRWLATGGGNWTSDVPGELKLWSVDDGSFVDLPGHRLSIWTVAFSPDGKTLATSSSDGCVKIWNLATRSVERTLNHDIWLRALDLSPDGKLLAVGRGDGPIRLWDTATWQEQVSLEGHDGFTFALDFSPDGKTIATAGNDGTVKLWSPFPPP